MEEENKDFLTPEERASLNPKEESSAYIVEKNISALSGERPTIITALCGYFFVSWVLTIIHIIGFYISLPKNASVSFNLTGFSLGGVVASILSLLYVASVFGLWLMKKWGVYLFLGVVVLGLIISSIATKSVTLFSFSSLLLPALVIWVGFKNIDKMS